MQRTLVVACALVTGCLADDYLCTTDADCNLGTAGRCELDGRCTVYDPSCESTERRYADHAGPRADVCYDDRTPLANLCAPDQPPSRGDDQCTASVCTTLPACCTTAWSEACVQLATADAACALDCEPWLAVSPGTGAFGNKDQNDSWTLRWNRATNQWMAHRESAGSLFWLAPSGTTSAPRLAVIPQSFPSTVVIDGVFVQLPFDHELHAVSSVAFDRDGRDTIAAGYFKDGAPNSDTNDVVLLKGATTRELGALAATAALVWGDANHDGFPDAAGGFNSSYAVVTNVDDKATHVRAAASDARSLSGNSSTAPGVRYVGWSDFNGDQLLDLVVIGNELRIAPGSQPGGVELEPGKLLARLDCDPPMVGGCAGNVGLKTTYTGVAIAAPSGGELVFAVHNQEADTQAVYRLRGTTVTPIAFPACGTPCVPILAIAAADLDSNRTLDVIAVDAKLVLYASMNGGPFAAMSSQPIAIAATTYTAARIAVSGAPR